MKLYWRDSVLCEVVQAEPRVMRRSIRLNTLLVFQKLPYPDTTSIIQLSTMYFVLLGSLMYELAYNRRQKLVLLVKSLHLLVVQFEIPPL